MVHSSFRGLFHLPLSLAFANRGSLLQRGHFQESRPWLRTCSAKSSVPTTVRFPRGMLSSRCSAASAQLLPPLGGGQRAARRFEPTSQGLAIRPSSPPGRLVARLGRYRSSAAKGGRQSRCRAMVAPAHDQSPTPEQTSNPRQPVPKRDSSRVGSEQYALTSRNKQPDPSRLFCFFSDTKLWSKP